jgi:hypothetical protein
MPPVVPRLGGTIAFSLKFSGHWKVAGDPSPSQPPNTPVHGAMANFRQFRPSDLNKLSKCNLDALTETYELSFYMQYYAKWPSLFQVAEDGDGNIIGYSEPIKG